MLCWEGRRRCIGDEEGTNKRKYIKLKLKKMNSCELCLDYIFPFFLWYHLSSPFPLFIFIFLYYHLQLNKQKWKSEVRFFF